MMATEVQSGDLNSTTSSRLEVSIDPDPEGEQSPVAELDPIPSEPGTDKPVLMGAKIDRQICNKEELGLSFAGAVGIGHSIFQRQRWQGLPPNL